MKKKTIIIFSLCFIAGVLARLAMGEPLLGQDYLALQYPKFKIDAALPYISQTKALGSLDFTFGEDKTNIEKALASGKFLFYRVHLIDGTCIANGSCGTYSPFRTFSLQSFEKSVQSGNGPVYNYITKHIPYYCDLKSRYPNIEIRVSPVLEHRLGVKSFRLLADKILTLCPSMGLVNNAVTGDGERYKGALLESHDGFKKPRDIVSFDGLDATDADIRKWLEVTKNVHVRYIWSRVYNCRNSGPFVDPRKRQSCPLGRDFEELENLTADRGKPPALGIKCTRVPFQAPKIWKPLSEDTGNKDPRINLPVAIVPFASKKDVVLIGEKGISIGVLKYYGSFDSVNMNRYYSGLQLKLSGYQMEKKSVITNGSPFLWLKQDNRCIGPIVAGRRNGSYR